MSQVRAQNIGSLAASLRASLPRPTPPAAVAVLGLLTVLSLVVASVLVKRRRPVARALPPEEGGWFKAQLAFYRQCKWSDELGCRLSDQEFDRLAVSSVRLEAVRRLGSDGGSAGHGAIVRQADSPLLELSTEVLVNICASLSAADICSMSLVCRRLRYVCADSYLWMQLFVRRHGPEAAAAIEGRLATPENLTLPFHWLRIYALNDVVASAGAMLRRSVANAVVSDDPADVARTVSRFGGEPLLLASDAGHSPLCGQCGRPMSLFVQLDMRALPSPQAARFKCSGALQLFICTGLGEQGTACPSAEPYSGASLVRILPLNDAGLVDPSVSTAAAAAAAAAPLPPPARAFPALAVVDWEHYVEDLGEYLHGGTPGPSVGYYDFLTSGLTLTRAERHSVADTLCIAPKSVLVRKRHPAERCRGFHFDPQETRPEETIVKAISVTDKLGGWPCHQPGLLFPECRLCGAAMDRLLLQLSSFHHVPWILGDCGVGHVLQCPNHLDQWVFRASIP